MAEIKRDDPKFNELLELVIPEYQKRGMKVDNIEAFKSSIESISLVGNKLSLNLYKGSIEERGEYFVGKGGRLK